MPVSDFVWDTDCFDWYCSWVSSVLQTFVGCVLNKAATDSFNTLLKLWLYNARFEVLTTLSVKTDRLGCDSISLGEQLPRLLRHCDPYNCSPNDIWSHPYNCSPNDIWSHPRRYEVSPTVLFEFRLLTKVYHFDVISTVHHSIELFH
jgi:hypothetical protein